jgi:eukaryotic-like serine/threonine-protein kinase
MVGCANAGGRAMTTIDTDDSDVVTEFLDPLTVRARTRIGQTLKGKWRLDVLLGVGGMAAVYAATHRNGSRVAVKILHPELSTNAEVRARFAREGHAANAVGHEGAVKVIDDDVAEDGSLYLVTELLDGETLEDRRVRSGGRLSEDEVLSVADQLLDVLAAAHARSVFHRDVKPANIFLTRFGQLKVLDFGIAHLREFSTGTLATKAGSAMGTPAFMSPEQARGLWSEVDGRSDLWSVGAAMWQVLTGTLVHNGRTANEELLSAMTKPAPPLASVLPDVSPAVAHVVDRALSFEKEKRWLSAERMQEGVRRAYHDRHGTPITTAAKIAVPASVPNKTLAGAPSVATPKQPTTARPVASSLASLKLLTLPSPRQRRIAAVAAGAVILVAGVWALSAGHHGEPPTASSSSSASTTGASHETAIIGPSQSTAPPRTIAATELPTATARPAPTEPTPAAPAPPAVAAPRAIVPANPPAAPKTTAAPSPPAPAQPPPAQVPAKPNCNPPYVIDPATGKKHFKVECL